MIHFNLSISTFSKKKKKYPQTKWENTKDSGRYQNSFLTQWILIQRKNSEIQKYCILEINVILFSITWLSLYLNKSTSSLSISVFLEISVRYSFVIFRFILPDYHHIVPFLVAKHFSLHWNFNFLSSFLIYSLIPPIIFSSIDTCSYSNFRSVIPKCQLMSFSHFLRWPWMNIRWIVHVFNWIEHFWASIASISLCFLCQNVMKLFL